MQVEKYSDRLKTLIQSAQTLALRSGHQQLTTLHVLKALLEDQEQLSANLIEAAGAARARSRARSISNWASCPRSRAREQDKSILLPRSPACSTRPSSCRRKPAIHSSPSNTCCWRFRWQAEQMQLKFSNATALARKASGRRSRTF